MRIVAVIVIAYLLTGALYVWRDLRRPIDKQPAYAKWGGIRSMVFIILYWLPGTLSFACRGGVLRDQAGPWAIFAALTVAGLYFSGI